MCAFCVVIIIVVLGFVAVFLVFVPFFVAWRKKWLSFSRLYIRSGLQNDIAILELSILLWIDCVMVAHYLNIPAWETVWFLKSANKERRKVQSMMVLLSTGAGEGVGAVYVYLWNFSGKRFSAIWKDKGQSEGILNLLKKKIDTAWKCLCIHWHMYGNTLFKLFWFLSHPPLSVCLIK